SGIISSSSNNTRMKDISVNVIVNGGATRTVQADANGAYHFTVSQGDSVSLWASPLPPYTYPFTPVQQQPGGTAQCRTIPPTSCFFPNIRQNEIQNFTTTYTTVFLIHGLGQTGTAMYSLWTSLSGQNPLGTGLDRNRFVVDTGFTV